MLITQTIIHVMIQIYHNKKVNRRYIRRITHEACLWYQLRSVLFTLSPDAMADQEKYHKLYLAYTEAHPRISKQKCQREVNELWKQMKKGEKKL